MPNDHVFAGVKVLDVASFIAGPGAATVLSDFGADVIKVEPPGAGDLQRILASVPPNPRAHANYAWHQVNRNKRGMAINLKSPGGTEILERLVKWADVLITNYPPAARERLHLTYDEVDAWNPRIVYADFTGFGNAGPDAALPGFDITAYWGRSGLLAMTRDAGAPPTLPVEGSGDFASAMGLYSAIVTGLYFRERTGRGTCVGTSLLAEGIWATGTLVSGSARPRRKVPHRCRQFGRLRYHGRGLVLQRQRRPGLEVRAGRYAADPRDVPDCPGRGAERVESAARAVH